MRNAYFVLRVALRGEAKTSKVNWRDIVSRQDIAQLYKTLHETEFEFMPRGIFHLHDVYAAVKKKYRHLCNDKFICDENCHTGDPKREWQHATSRALDVLTTRTVKSEIVLHARRGYWEFR
jgi:hypothetical protein